MKHVGLFAFLGGAIAGAAVAVLMAPRRGDETRRMLGEFIHRGVCSCHMGGCSMDNQECDCAVNPDVAQSNSSDTQPNK